MYKIINHINNVKKFYAQKKGICYFLKDGKLFHDKQLIKESKDIDSQNFFFNENFVFYRSNKKFEYFIKNLKTNEITTIKNKAFIKLGICDRKALMYRQENSSFYLSYNNLADGATIFDLKEFLNITIGCQDEEAFYLRTELNEVLKLGKNGIKLWKMDTSELSSYKEYEVDIEHKKGKIHEFLGIYKSKLLLAITNNTILSIDIKTGKLSKKWRELPKGIKWSNQNFDVLPYPKQSILLKEEGKIIGLLYTYYWEIDLKTEEVHFHDATETFQKYKTQTVTGGEISHQGDYIFFCGDKNSIGAFNRKTKVLDWFYQFDFDAETFITSYAPKVEGNRLFVMDNKGTLYIFEKIQTKDL